MGGLDCSTVKVFKPLSIFCSQPLESCEMQKPWLLSSKLVIFKTKDVSCDT